MCSQNFYNLQDSITTNKLERMRCVGHLDAWDRKEMQSVVGENEGKRHVLDLGMDVEIKTDFWEIKLMGVGLLHIACDEENWQHILEG